MPAYSGGSVRTYNALPLLGCATRSVGASRERTIEQCSPSSGHDRIGSAVCGQGASRRGRAGRVRKCPSLGTSRMRASHSALRIDRTDRLEERKRGMGLLQRLKHDLKAGLATLRLGTAQAANRALEETEVLRLRLEVRRIDQQLNELYRDVGERAVSLREAGEPVERVIYDTEISRLVKEIHQLKATSEKLQAEMQEIRDAE